MINDVTINLDLSDKNAQRTYSCPENACFIATFENSPKEVIASSCILIGEEKNSYCHAKILPLKNNPKEALITRVGTLPKYHGMGAGRAVVQACVDFARSKNVKTIKLATSSAQHEAINLYKSIGFQITKKHALYDIFGFYELILELDLS